MTNFEYAQKIKNGELPPIEVELKQPLLDHEYVSSSFCFLMQKSMELDEMGVGKTMTAIGSCKLLSEKETAKVVVFAPGSTLYQWSKAIDDFLGWKVIIVDGDKYRRASQYQYFDELKENCVLLTNYSRPLKDPENMLRMSPNMIILDEATYVKNPEAEIYKFISKFTKLSENIILLTGTPITLSLGDFYWLFCLLNIDGVVGSFEEEVLPYLETKTVRGRRNVIGASDFSAFLDKISPYTIRRTLVEVLSDSDDPFAQFVNEKPQLFVECLQYDNNQAEVFQELKINANRCAREGTYKPLETYQQFLQACSSPKLILESYQNKTPKEKFLIKYIDDHSGKIVVYVRYLEFLKCLKTTLDSVKIGYNIITGQLSSYEQEEQKNNFLKSENRVLFITGAGKYGLNLQKADNFLFLDIPYNPADLLQMINRVYRYGQLGDVKVTLAFLENTIEEDIFRKLQKRQAVLDEYFETDLSKIFQRDPNYIWGFLEKDYPKLE